MLVVFVGGAGGHRLPVHQRPQGLHSRQDNDQLHVNTEARRAHRSIRCPRHQTDRGRDRPRESGHRGLHADRRAAASARRPEHGQLAVRAEAARANVMSRRSEIAQQLRPQLAQLPGHARVSSTFRRRSASAAAVDQQLVPVHAAERRTPRALRAGAASSKARSAQLPAVQDVTTDLQISTPQVNVEDRPRQGRGARPERHADRQRLLRRLRPALGRPPSTAPTSQYRVAARS